MKLLKKSGKFLSVINWISIIYSPKRIQQKRITDISKSNLKKALRTPVCLVARSVVLQTKRFQIDVHRVIPRWYYNEWHIFFFLGCQLSQFESLSQKAWNESDISHEKSIGSLISTFLRLICFFVKKWQVCCSKHLNHLKITNKQTWIRSINSICHRCNRGQNSCSTVKPWPIYEFDVLFNIACHTCYGWEWIFPNLLELFRYCWIS